MLIRIRSFVTFISIQLEMRLILIIDKMFKYLQVKSRSVCFDSDNLFLCLVRSIEASNFFIFFLNKNNKRFKIYRGVKWLHMKTESNLI